MHRCYLPLSRHPVPDYIEISIYLCFLLVLLVYILFPVVILLVRLFTFSADFHFCLYLLFLYILFYIYFSTGMNSFVLDYFRYVFST
jgi:hypothetical protein